MKSLVLSVSLFLTLSVTTLSFAQSSKLSIGVDGGVGPSNALDGIGDSGIGFTIKLTSQYNLSHILSINAGLGFEQRSSSHHIDIIDSIQSSDMLMNWNFDFLTLPILLRANFGTNVKYFINAGPYFSYLLKEHGYVTDNIENTEEYSEGTNYYNRFESGVSVGIGLSIPLIQRLSLSIETRGNIGLSNLSTIEGATHNTNSAYLLIGLSYHL